MTGNNKVWRAPVAGLASVAMLATMGVATASAAESVPTDNYTVDLANYGSITVWPGETIADAFYRHIGTFAKPYNSSFSSTSIAGTPAHGEVFVGFVDASGNPVNVYTDKVTSDMKVTSKFVPADEAVKIQYTGVNSGSDPYVFFPYNANNTFYVEKNSTIGDAAPVDAADGQIVTTWNVNYGSTSSKSDTTTTDIANFNVADPEAGATLTISPAKDGVVKAETASFAASIPSAHIFGSYTDGDEEVNTYSVDTTGKVTVPDFVYDGTLNTVVKATGWKVVGGNVAIGDQVNSGKYTDVNTTTGYKVKFDSKGGSSVPAQWVEAGSYADEPTAPTREGKVFKGWKNANAYFDFEATRITGPLTLEAQWDDASTVTVTFVAGSYKGAPKDVEVKLDSDEFLSEDQAPDWTREGYVLAYWTRVDASGTEHGKFDFTAKVVGQVVDSAQPGQDFTLRAVWTPVDDDIAKAALRYVRPDIVSADKVLGKAPSDEEYFTSDSWKTFVPVWEAAYKKYETAKYNAPEDKISAATATEIVSDLKAGWKKLVFKHKTQADAMGAETVHRLSKGGEHFYSRDAKEVAYMCNNLTTSGGWTDEGRLFEAASTDAGKFADFNAAANGNDQVASDLAKAADPILTAINRAYNKVNGDHVWTADANEYETLSNQSNWNAEGEAFYVPTFTGTTDVVRLYKANRHLLSTDANEQQVLAGQQGWTNEGTAFLGY